MIRLFIEDDPDGEGPPSFMFVDTVTDRPFECCGEVVWHSWWDFLEAWQAAAGHGEVHVAHPLAPFEALVPESWRAAQGVVEGRECPLPLEEG